MTPRLTPAAAASFRSYGRILERIFKLGGYLGGGSMLFKVFFTQNHGGEMTLKVLFPEGCCCGSNQKSNEAGTSQRSNQAETSQRFNQAFNSCRDGLSSFKQFMHKLEDDILPAEAVRRYQEYRSKFISTQKRAFFDAHKDEEWLREKYHPTNLLRVIERRNENSKKRSKEFLLAMQSKTLDIGPAFNAAATGKSGQASVPNTADVTDVGGKRGGHGRGGSTRENDRLSSAPKAHPVSSDPERIQFDIEQAQALTRRLDKEKGIADNFLCNADQAKPEMVTIPEGSQLLDTLLTYLWRIHGIDYYGLIESNEAKGFRHVRSETENSDDTDYNAAIDWEKKLDTFWGKRMSCQDPLQVMTAKDKIEAAAGELVKTYIRNFEDGKYGCWVHGCTEIFHELEDVINHFRPDHPEFVMDLTVKVREDLYFENYMSDQNAPGSIPVCSTLFRRRSHKGVGWE